MLISTTSSAHAAFSSYRVVFPFMQTNRLTLNLVAYRFVNLQFGSLVEVNDILQIGKNFLSPSFYVDVVIAQLAQ